MERDKALDMALGNIEKQFGKGAIMRMGEDAKVKIASIPTGAISLDLALGIGGLPRGRVIEIYGPESSGKCHTADTYVWTDHGLETIEELFARCGQPASCTSRITDVTEQGVRLVNEEGELEALGGLTHNNRRPVTRVELESGRHVKATANHPLRVLNERGRIVWRTVGELREGDVLVSALFGADDAVGNDTLTEDEAVLLGYLVAEGSLGAANRHSIRFTNAHDPDVFAEYVTLLDTVLGIPEHRIKTYADKDHVVHDTQLRRRLAEEYGLDYVGSAAKEIPHRVRTGGPKIQRAFLTALYEGDGWVEKGPEVGLTTASRTLAEQVQLLLFGLGVPASLTTKHNTKLDRDYHTVLVTPGGVKRFLEVVGFRSARRAEAVARHVGDVRCNSRLEHIPHLGDLLRDLRDAIGGDRELDSFIHDLSRTNLSRRPEGRIDCSPRRLAQVLGWIADRPHIPASARSLVAQLHELASRPLTFERVTALVDEGPQPTFDVVVPRTHSFVANGVLSHNTTVALHAIAEAQKAGGIAAFIDAEHALDPSYAAALGVDVEALLVSQPDTGEQALEITDMLIRSGAIDIVVIDSVAALTPRAEIEGEMGDTHVGLQARLMSQALRKLAGTLNRSRTSAVFINQLREKIGVMFGCFSAETRVTLADGTQEKIGKIVNQKMAVEVLSYDPQLDAIVPKRVTNWFDNGPTAEFLQFTVARPAGNGRSQFAATENHLIQTPGGWREAGELLPGDRVLQTVTHRLSPLQWEAVLGSLMGDGALSPTRSGHGARFRWGHGAKQAAYADWKASLFANIGTSRSTNDRGAVFHDLAPLPELAELREAVYVAGKKVLSYDYIKQLTPLSIALWYMDDGGFTVRSKGLQERTAGGSGRAEICVEAMESSSRRRLRDHIADTWQIEAKLVERGGKAILQFPTAETPKLHELVAPYIHPSMDYKLLPRFRGAFAVEPQFVEPAQKLMPMPILSIERQAPHGRATHRFDIQVEGTHNYFVDHVMVHNSPETTPGGRALKFYSSVRLDVRRIESLKDGTDVVGNRVRVKVVKNKCLAAGSLVFDPTTGLTHTIEDIVDNDAGAAVWAADKRGQLHVRAIKARMNQGQQEVVGVGLRDGTRLRMTPDHRVLTDTGWREAGELAVGDRVARPRRAGGFGDGRPVPVDHARMLGYLIGDGYVGGKTPIAFINTQESLIEDAIGIASSLGCSARRTHEGIHVHFSHRPGEKNELLALTRWAGIYGHLAPSKVIPSPFFAEDVAEDVVANLLFGIFESDGWVAREQTGGIRCGFTTTSEQLARQIHWLLLRWGITSSIRVSQPGSRRSLIAGRPVVGKLPCWETRITGIDNVVRLAEALPMWGPRGQKLTAALDDPALAKHRGSQAGYLPAAATEPVLAYLRNEGVSAAVAVGLVGSDADPRGGLRQVLGHSRLRRDRLERLADALDSEFLRDYLVDDLYYARITEITPAEWAQTYDIEVDELHNLVADDIVVHNCAPPFRQAEFDIMYGEGISKEGSLIDVGVEHAIVKKAGAWYTYEGEQLGQGRENARKFLREHSDVADEIYKKITEKLGLVPTDVTGDEMLGEVADDDEE